MGGKIPRILVGALLLTTLAIRPAASQQTQTDELTQEIRALKEDVKAIRKDLREIKALLARRTPPPTGVGVVIDVGNNPAQGERTANLTMVEFSDYQ
jgi:hypothetical protein